MFTNYETSELEGRSLVKGNSTTNCTKTKTVVWEQCFFETDVPEKKQTNDKFATYEYEENLIVLTAKSIEI